MPRRIFLLVVVAAALCLPAQAAAATLFVPRVPASATTPPPGYRLNAQQALAIATRNAKVQRAVHAPGPSLVARPYLLGTKDFLVRYSRGGRLVVQVDVDGRNGAVRWADAGREIDWPPVQHGHHGPRNQRVHWVLGLAALLFFVPFFDRRRPFRLLHLDLLAILALGVSFAIAETGRVYVSTPLMYPPLVYLLVRGVMLALGRARPPSGELTWMRPSTMARGLVVLMVLRVAWVVIDGTVRDIGYASVFGADSIINGYPIYSALPHSAHFDAYGPLMYLAYVPFTLLIPLKDLAWSHAQAATAAALTFDLATVACLYVLGARLRDRRLGLCLAWAYAACPWSIFVIADGPNDGLVALLLVVVLLVLARPAWRAFVLALAVAAKLGPLALAPLLARVDGDRRGRSLVAYAGVLIGTVVLLFALFLPDGGVREVWNSTVKFQATRTAPYSMWGLHPAWEPVKYVVMAFAAALAAAGFFLPRERTLERLAAAGAAILIAVQLTTIYWYWYYVVWFLPYLLVAVFSTSYAGSVRNSGSSGASAVASNSSRAGP